MKKIKKYFFLILLCGLTGCATYSSPDRATWQTYLNGASFTDMTEMSRVAKRPVYLGAGGKLVTNTVQTPSNMEYGDKIQNDNTIATHYMSVLEYDRSSRGAKNYINLAKELIRRSNV